MPAPARTGRVHARAGSPDSTARPGGGPSALIVNAYAIGNWGDAAIVDGMLGSLRSAGFTRVSIAPVDWHQPAAWYRLGVDEVVPPLLSLLDAPSWTRRLKPALLLYAIARMLRTRVGGGGPAADAYRRTDLVVSAGGSYLGGSKPGVNLIKLGNLWAGTHAGRPTLTAPITINPSSRIVRRLMRWGFRSATLFVRDAPSREVLREIGLASEVVPDIALRAGPLTARLEGPVEPRRPTGVIGWAPRGYRADHRQWGDSAAAEQTILAAIERLMAASELRLRLIAQVRAAADDDDELAVDRLTERLRPRFGSRVEISRDVESLADAVERYADLDVLITSRMHAALFALSVGTPALAVAYEPKVQGVMDSLGLSDRVMPATGGVTSEDVERMISRLLQPGEVDRTRTAFVASQERFGPFDRVLSESAREAIARHHLATSASADGPLR